jgi:hypothetical protein
MHRDTIVSINALGLEEVRMMLVLAGGSSKVFKKALADSWFMRSASRIRATLRWPEMGLCWMFRIISRVWSTLI